MTYQNSLVPKNKRIKESINFVKLYYWLVIVFRMSFVKLFLKNLFDKEIPKVVLLVFVK